MWGKLIYSYRKVCEKTYCVVFVVVVVVSVTYITFSLIETEYLSMSSRHL